MPPIRCIFLDLGRTLIDLDLGVLGARMVELAGVQPQDLQQAVVGDGLASRFETGAVTEDEFHEEVCRRLGKEIAKRDFYSAWNTIFLPDPILPDTVISDLAAKAPLWSLSNTNSVHFRYLSGTYEFFRHFTGHVLSFETGFQKPDQRIFRCALEKAQVAAAEVVFADDLLSNIESARGLGIDAFQFLSPEQFIQEMRSRRLLE